MNIIEKANETQINIESNSNNAQATFRLIPSINKTEDPSVQAGG